MGRINLPVPVGLAVMRAMFGSDPKMGHSLVHWNGDAYALSYINSKRSNTW